MGQDATERVVLTRPPLSLRLHLLAALTFKGEPASHKSHLYESCKTNSTLLCSTLASLDNAKQAYSTVYFRIPTNICQQTNLFIKAGDNVHHICSK